MGTLVNLSFTESWNSNWVSRGLERNIVATFSKLSSSPNDEINCQNPSENITA